jgi:hypothetical protein
VFLGHAPHRFAKLFLLRGEAEIHGIPYMICPNRDSTSQTRRAASDCTMFKDRTRPILLKNAMFERCGFTASIQRKGNR